MQARGSDYGPADFDVIEPHRLVLMYLQNLPVNYRLPREIKSKDNVIGLQVIDWPRPGRCHHQSSRGKAWQLRLWVRIELCRLLLDVLLGIGRILERCVSTFRSLAGCLTSFTRFLEQFCSRLSPRDGGLPIEFFRPRLVCFSLLSKIVSFRFGRRLLRLGSLQIGFEVRPLRSE